MRRMVHQVLGQRGDNYLQTVANTIRAVIYGILATALAQGALAGLGYWAAGLPAPVLLAVITLLFSFLPFGTPLVWGAASIWLLVHGQIAAGVGLALWGALVVSWIDNLIRPLVISSAVHIPFLLVLFGVLGGILTFGLLGLFLGPVILAVLLAIWREWLQPPPSAET
jgi:Predicted permease